MAITPSENRLLEAIDKTIINVTQRTEEVNTLQRDNKNVNETIKIQNKKVEDLERFNQIKNLIIYGIPETSNETYTNRQETLINL